MPTFLLCLLVAVLNLLWVGMIGTGYDPGEFATGIIAMAGCGAFLYYAATKRLSIVMAFALIPAVYAGARACFFPVPGYTMFELARILGFCGLVLLVSTCKPKAVYILLMASGLWAMLSAYGFEMSYEVAKKNWSWGFMRSHIIFGTVVYGGIVGAYKMITTTEGVSKWAGLIYMCLGTFAIFHSGSDMIMGIMVLSICYGLYEYKQKRLALVILALAVVAAVYFRPAGSFGLRDCRTESWGAVCQGILSSPLGAIFGNGLGAWQLHAGVLGVPNLGHPHNELLQIIFEQGIVGALLWVCFAFVVLQVSEDKAIRVALILLTFSTLTNSARYPWVMLPLACVYGLAFRYSAELDHEEMPRCGNVQGFAYSMIGIFLVFICYEQLCSDAMLSKAKGRHQYEIYNRLRTGWSLESRYFSNMNLLIFSQKLDPLPDAIRSQCKQAAKDMNVLAEKAPGYKEIPVNAAIFKQIISNTGG